MPTIVLPCCPARPVSENEIRGKHWAVARKLTQPWRDVTYSVARHFLARPSPDPALRLPHAQRDPSPITVAVEIPFPRGGRRDPHNYTSTVVKAIIDGLVLAEIVADDTPEWVTVIDPSLVIGGRPRIHIKRRPTQ